MCMKLHRNVFFLENGWRNVGGVMKSFFCNHKKILFEHRLAKSQPPQDAVPFHGLPIRRGAMALAGLHHDFLVLARNGVIGAEYRGGRAGTIYKAHGQLYRTADETCEVRRRVVRHRIQGRAITLPVGAVVIAQIRYRSYG